jgi:hypothetical protein
MPDLVGVLLAVTAAALVALFTWRRHHHAQALDQAQHDDPSHIHLCTLFARPPAFDPETLAATLAERWGIAATCAESPDLGRPEPGVTTYLLGHDAHAMRLRVSTRPLPENLTRISIQGSPGLEPSAAAEVARHQGFILADDLAGPPDAVERVRFAAMALLALLESEGALGHVNTSAMCYQTRDTALARVSDDDLNAAALYLLFTNRHLVDEGSRRWLHTHGMEQFRLPDLQVRFADPDQTAAYDDLIGNTAVYLIENGPILEPGHTASLAGDERVFGIKATPPDPQHPFGAQGCLEIVPP